MKGTIESGLLALKGFYEVVNTKEKAALLILVWLLVNLGGLTYRFATIEAVERLIIVTTCRAKHSHEIEGIKHVESVPSTIPRG